MLKCGKHFWRLMHAPTPHEASKQFEGTLLRGYRVTRLLGQGGMGAVYEGVSVEKKPGRKFGGIEKVAIKVLSADMAFDKTAIKRFMHEARATSRVEHPGLVRLLAYGQTDAGWPYIMMEFLDGESLRSRLEQRGQFPINSAIRLMRDMGVALAAAHNKGIIHRDLKPDNLMLIANTSTSTEDNIKILDFGIAKIVEATGQETVPGFKTATGAIMGTPRYMSPEQCRGCGPHITSQSDVYSCGVILFEMLAGVTPFQSKAFGDMLIKHVMEPPPLLRTLRPDASPAIENLINRMLAKDSKERPAIKEVVHILTELIDGQATVAVGREHAPTRKVTWRDTVLPALSRRIIKRYWRFALAGLASLLALIMLSVFINYKLKIKYLKQNENSKFNTNQPLLNTIQPAVSQDSEKQVNAGNGGITAVQNKDQNEPQITTHERSGPKRKKQITKQKTFTGKEKVHSAGDANDIGLKSTY